MTLRTIKDGDAPATKSDLIWWACLTIASIWMAVGQPWWAVPWLVLGAAAKVATWLRRAPAGDGVL